MKALITSIANSLTADLKEDVRRHLDDLVQDIRDGKWKVRIVIERKE